MLHRLESNYWNFARSTVSRIHRREHHWRRRLAPIGPHKTTETDSRMPEPTEPHKTQLLVVAVAAFLPVADRAAACRRTVVAAAAEPHKLERNVPHKIQWTNYS